MKSCTSGETGREGERADRRNTAFPKCRLPKGDAEPQVIIFIKTQKKTLNSPTAGVYCEFFSAKNKKIQKMQPPARAVCTPLLSGAGHSIC